MNEKETKKQIDNAVRIFRETLEKTYLKNGLDFHGIGIEKLTNFLSGKVSIQRKANGNLRLSGELPKVMFNDNCKNLPNELLDWDIFPIVITFFNKKFEDKNE